MTEIARLKIELDEMEPPVLRRIEVPQTIRLDDLHVVIQAAMGWENYHMYEFRVGRTVAYGLTDPDWPDTDTQSAKKATLADLIGRLKRNKTFHYIYDFGDDWLHIVKLEALVEADPEFAYPRLDTVQGRCPPEDSGGPWGYAHFLEAFSDPDHEDHDEMVDWHGPDFDPDAVDEDARRKAVARLAKSRRRKTRAKRN
jgi:GNAT superfamily N-acetyltransferase